MLLAEAPTRARQAWANRHRAAAAATAILMGLATAYALVLFDNPGITKPGAAATGLLDRLSLGPALAVAAAVAAAATWWYRRSVLTRPFMLTAAILATIATVTTITGLSFQHHRDACLWTTCGSPQPWAGLTPAAALGLLAVYYAVVSGIVQVTDRLTTGGRARTKPDTKPTMPPPQPRRTTLGRAATRVGSLVIARPFATAAVVIAVAWVPYLVVFFPGTYAFDGFRQLNEFYGYLPRTTHHPYLATTLMGGLFSIGKVVGVNGALFCYTLVQAVLGCLVFALTCARVLRLTTAAVSGRRRLVMAAYGLTLAFFALSPVFPVGATVVFKDFPYTLSVLVLVNVLVAAAVRRSMDGKALALFVAGAVGAAGFRNDGIVIVAACAVCLALVLSARRLRVLVAAGAVAAGLVVVNVAVFPALGVTKYSNAEALSVPLQQTARYLKVHPEDVTAAERATLQSLLKDGRSVDELADEYRPNLSDPVKNRFSSFSGDGLKDYVGVWWAMFLRHPATYVEATAANTIGYFHPLPKTSTPPIQYPDNMHSDPDYWDGMKAELSQPQADFDPHYPDALASARTGVVAAVKWTVALPIVGLVYNPALYTWLLAIGCALAIRRGRWRSWLPYVPAALVFLVCLASPVNGNLRYALPYVVTVPLLMAYSLYVVAVGGRGRGLDQGVWPTAGHGAADLSRRGARRREPARSDGARREARPDVRSHTLADAARSAPSP